MLLLSFWKRIRPDTVSLLEHAECKPFVQAIVCSQVTEGWNPEFRENYKQKTYMKVTKRQISEDKGKLNN